MLQRTSALAELNFVRGIPFQDAAKAGLQFGDEGELESGVTYACNLTHWFDRP